MKKRWQIHTDSNIADGHLKIPLMLRCAGIELMAINDRNYFNAFVHFSSLSRYFDCIYSSTFDNEQPLSREDAFLGVGSLASLGADNIT